MKILHKHYGFKPYRLKDKQRICEINYPSTNFLSTPVEAELNILQEIVEQEQPVHIRELSRRFSPIYAHTRVTKRLCSKVKDLCTNPEYLGGVLKIHKNFVFCNGFKEVHVRYRTGDMIHERDIALICIEELMQALRKIMLVHGPISKITLFDFVRKALGFKKNGVTIVNYLAKALEEMQLREDVVENNNLLSLTLQCRRRAYEMGDFVNLASRPDNLSTNKAFRSSSEMESQQLAWNFDDMDLSDWRTGDEIDMDSIPLKHQNAYVAKVSNQQHNSNKQESIMKSDITLKNSKSRLSSHRKEQPARLQMSPPENYSLSSEDSVVSFKKSNSVTPDLRQIEIKTPQEVELFKQQSEQNALEQRDESREKEKNIKDVSFSNAVQKALQQLKQESETKCSGESLHSIFNGLEPEESLSNASGCVGKHEEDIRSSNMKPGGENEAQQGLDCLMEETQEFSNDIDENANNCSESVVDSGPSGISPEIDSQEKESHVVIADSETEIQECDYVGTDCVTCDSESECVAPEKIGSSKSAVDLEETTIAGWRQNEETDNVTIDFECGVNVDLRSDNFHAIPVPENAEDDINLIAGRTPVKDYIRNVLLAIMGAPESNSLKVELVCSCLDKVWNFLFPHSTHVTGTYSYDIALIVGVVPFPGMLRVCTGRYASGIVQFILCIFIWKWFYIWWLYDAFLLLMGDYADGEGKSLKGYSKPKAFAALAFLILICCFFVNRFLRMSSSVLD